MEGQKAGAMNIEVGAEYNPKGLSEAKKDLNSFKTVADNASKSVQKSLGEIDGASAEVAVSYDTLSKSQQKSAERMKKSMEIASAQTKADAYEIKARHLGILPQMTAEIESLRKIEQQRKEAAIASELHSKAMRAEEQALRSAEIAKARATEAGKQYVANLERQTATIGMTRKQILEYEAAQMGVSAQAQPHINKMFDTGNAYRAVGMSAKQTQQAMRLLPAQITDIVTSLASGMPVYLIAIQQGGQLRDSFGGFGGMLKGVMTLISPAIVLFASLAAAGGALAYAYNRVSEVASQLNKSLITTGNISGQTGAQLLAMSERISGVVGSQQDSSKALTAIISSNTLLGQSYEDIASAAVAWSQVTGKSIEDVVKEFGSIAKDPVAAMKTLNEQYNFLTASTYEQATALIEQGNNTEATRIIIEQLEKTISDRVPLMVEQTGLLTSAWGNLKMAFGDATESFANFAFNFNLESKLADTTAELQKLRDTFGEIPFDDISGIQSQIDGLEALQSRLQSQIATQNESAKASRQQHEETQLQIKMTDFLTKGKTQEQQAYIKLNQLVFVYNQLMVASKTNTEDVTRLTQAMVVQFNAIADGLNKGETEQKKYGGTVKDVNAEILKSIANYQYETEMMLVNSYERDRANFMRDLEGKGIKENTKAWREYVEAFDAATLSRQAQDGMVKRLKDEKDLAEKSVKERIKSEEKFAREAEKINDQIGQSLADALMNGSLSAKDFIINMFKTMVLRPIIQPLLTGVSGALGLGASGAALAGNPGSVGGTGTFDMISMLKSGYDALSGGFTSTGSYAAQATAMAMGHAGQVTALVSAQSALTSAQASLLSAEIAGATVAAESAAVVSAQAAVDSAVVTLNSTASTATSIGAATTVLAGIAAGFAAGMLISGDLSITGNAMTEVAIGTAIGAAVGSVVPVVGTALGAFVGGTLGGLVNRAFGSGSKQVQASGVTGNISAGGSSLASFSQWSKKGGWFGGGGSGTDISAIDAGTLNYFNQTTSAIGSSIDIMARSMGVSVDNINAYSQAINLNLKGLNDEQIQEAIGNTLKSFSNNLINFVIPAVQFMGKEGETSTDTLIRLSTNLNKVNQTFSLIKVGLMEISLVSAKAASDLIDLAGGIDSFTQKIDYIYQNFYSAQERVAMATEQTTAVLSALGLYLPNTRDGFKDLFQVIAGSGSASLTAALLDLAPVVNEIIKYTEALTEAESKRLEQIRNEGLGLEKQMLELLKDTVELRRLELLTLDESNRALQISLFGVADAQFAASRAASETDKSFSDLKDVIASQLSLALTNLQTNFDLLTVSINNQITATQVAKAIANENLNSLNQIFSTLSTNIIGILGDVQSMQTAKQGFAFVTNALTSAQNTGYMPDNDQLSQAVGAARSGLGSSNFSSAFEQQKASLGLANQLIQLRGIAGDQMSTAERQVELSEKLLDAFNQRIRQADLIHNLESDLTKWVFDKQSQYADNQLKSIVALRSAMYNVDGSINTNFAEDKKRIESQMALDKFLFDQQIAYAGFNIAEIKNVKSAIFGSSSNQMDWLKNIQAVLFNLDGSINLSAADQINELAKLGSTVVGGVGLNIDKASDKTFVQFLQTLKAQGVISDEQLKYAERQIGSIFGVENSVFDVETAIQALKGELNNNFGVENAVYTVRDAINLLAVNINSERGSLNAVLSSLVAVQQDVNARAKAEAERLAAERQAAIDRAAAEAKALAEAQQRVAQAAANKRAADAAALAAQQAATAAEAKRRADAAAAAAEAERLRRQAFVDSYLDYVGIITGGLLGNAPPTTTPTYDPNYVSWGGSQNAEGGMFQGGLSLVGEEGPELVNFARPSMIYTAGETENILNNGASNADLSNEVRQLRAENKAQSRSMVSLQNRMTKLLESWDNNGLPQDRVEA